MRKKLVSLSLAIILSILSCVSYVPMTVTAREDNSTIAKLENEKVYKKLSAHGSIKPYSDHWWGKKAKIKESLKNYPGLAYSISFSDRTEFSGLPKGFNKKQLIEWGKYPGLNVDVLHKYGFNGKGCVIAYIDQPLSAHKEYSDNKLHYTNLSELNDSMHGPAVLSLLKGKNIGTAPKSEVYYYAHSSWKRDQKTHAECLYAVIKQNKKLKDAGKETISMVGFSDNIDNTEKNVKAFKKAVKACEDAGIMVWFCGDNGEATFIPNSDKNNPENLVPSQWSSYDAEKNYVFVPGGGRTTAATEDGAEYIFWPTNGGVSWTMPYTLGLYAIVHEIKPQLTQEEIKQLVVDTAYENSQSMRIINPVELVATALDMANKKSDAKRIRNEVKKRNAYYYALYNSEEVSNKDLTSIGNYLSTLTDGIVVPMDVSSFDSANEIYDAIKKDHKSRGGKIKGVQIFGDGDMVPAFTVSYKAKLEKGVDKIGTYETDFFFSNLANNSKLLNENYSIYKHFKDNLKIDLVPKWPVVRLPLAKGEFTDFFKKYYNAELKTGLTPTTLVNFSNPIFNQKKHIDDMGEFLIRLDKELKVLKSNYRLYGNKDGDCPVTTKVLGNFTKNNLAKENKKGICEFVINSHGQKNNIDQCYFKKGKEVRKSLVNSKNINSVFSKNAYYLDCWCCNNGSEMKDNITTTALKGRALGMFSATTIISNNGVDNKASVTKMKDSNFYYFYYNYLLQRDKGKPRATAFYLAEKAYAEALIAHSKRKFDDGANYQFNLNNLLAYHNFGVIENSVAAVALLDFKSTIKSDDEPAEYTVELIGTGNPITEYAELTYENDDPERIRIESATYCWLDNGGVRLKFKYETSKKHSLYVFNPPNGGSLYKKKGIKTKGTLYIDISKQQLENQIGVTIMFYGASDSDRGFLYLRYEDFKS